MNSKERVLAALNFQKADRLPRYEIFFEDFISNWRKSKNLPENTNIYDYYKKVDIGYIFRACNEGGPFFTKKGIEKRDGAYERDSWGRLLKKRKDAYFFEEVEFAINEKTKLDKFIFDSPSLDERYTVFEKDLEYAKERFALVSGVLGLYMGCYYLRGNVNFLMDTVEDVPFCQNLAYKVMNFTKEMGLSTLERSNTWGATIWTLYVKLLIFAKLRERQSPVKAFKMRGTCGLLSTDV
ncbi:hypothetical protein KAW55_07725 [bacterium]|nr:hypothetical protein [bacterium]